MSKRMADVYDTRSYPGLKSGKLGKIDQAANEAQAEREAAERWRKGREAAIKREQELAQAKRERARLNAAALARQTEICYRERGIWVTK